MMDGWMDRKMDGWMLNYSLTLPGGAGCCRVQYHSFHAGVTASLNNDLMAAVCLGRKWVKALL